MRQLSEDCDLRRLYRRAVSTSYARHGDAVPDVEVVHLWVGVHDRRLVRGWRHGPPLWRTLGRPQTRPPTVSSPRSRAVARGRRRRTCGSRAAALAAVADRLPPAFTVDVRFKASTGLPATAAVSAADTSDGLDLTVHHVAVRSTAAVRDATTATPHLTETVHRL